MSGWSLVQPMLQKRGEVSARHNAKNQLTKTRNQIVRYLSRLHDCGVIFHQHCVSELLGGRDSCLPDLEQTTHCSFSCCALSTAHWILPTWPLKSSQRCLATARNYYCDHPTEAVSGSSRYTGMMLSITFRHDPAEASGPQSQEKQDMVLYSNTSCRREPPDVREPDGCLRAETMRKSSCFPGSCRRQELERAVALTCSSNPRKSFCDNGTSHMFRLLCCPQRV